MKPTKISIVYIEPYKKEEKDTFELVKNTLIEKNIEFNLVKRENLSKDKLKDSDLIIVIGGDGTFLRTSHFTDEQLIFGVNCTCGIREGFFLRSNFENFKRNFESILNDEFKVVELTRIIAVIDGYESEPALNEIYVGKQKAYRTFQYELNVNGKKEIQKSSGFLIGTAAGSHAWLRSAGGKTLPLDSKEIQYHVREPYFGRINKPTLLKGSVSQIQIKSMSDGIVVIDSTSEEYNFSKENNLTIKRAEPLKFVEF